MEIVRRYPIQLVDFRDLNIALIGCGGTGSFLALHLARLAYHARQRQGLQLNLLFVDPDVVEAGNLGRQNFCHAELGRPKSKALATRYAAAFGLPIKYLVETFDRDQLYGFNTSRGLCLAIGAVDSAAGRQELHTTVAAWRRGAVWWLDCGNHENSGQVLLGNDASQGVATISPLGFCSALPDPAMQHPEILEPPPVPTLGTQSCAELLLTDVQSLMVNQAVAGWAATYVSRLLLSRDLDLMATYFDLVAGSARSVPITGAIPRKQEEDQNDD